MRRPFRNTSHERTRMRSLLQIAQDLKGLSEILQDQAAQLQEVIEFFGGSGIVGTASKDTTAPTANQKGESDPTTPRVKRAYTRRSKPRTLSTEEKEGIKKDWESLPPSLRTKENRLALSRKWQCSPQQVNALNQPSLMKGRPKKNPTNQ